MREKKPAGMPRAMSKPKITIITASYNAEAFIEHTIRSVAAQTYPNIEYIVIDGASTDGTLDVIKKHEDRITKWISEPDRGIADAMNKGWKMASGDFVLFLHADDYLIDDSTIDDAVQHMLGEYDIYAFGIYFSRWWRGGRRQRKQPRGFTWLMNLKYGVCHQGAFCRRELFEEIGQFDTNFKIAMDYDFFMRAYRRGKSLKVVHRVVSVMRDTGISWQMDWPSQRDRLLEIKSVHYKSCNGLLMRVGYFLFWQAYFPYWRLRSVVIALEMRMTRSTLQQSMR